MGQLQFREPHVSDVQGIASTVRPQLWPLISGAKALQHKRGSTYYTECLSRLMSREGHPHLKQIDLDIARTFPEHAYFRTPDGLGKLRNVLVAYAAHNPGVGYCQGLNFVVGFMLLVLRHHEEDTFWLLCALIEGMTGAAVIAFITAAGHVKRAGVCVAQCNPIRGAEVFASAGT